MDKELLESAVSYVQELLAPLTKHYYHSFEHADDVMTRAMDLAKKEGLSEKEVLLLGIAGVFHDTGFIVQYDKNEPIGAHIAKNFLQARGVELKNIALIERIIFATDPDYHKPKDIYEKIIKDADMDNLGRDDFYEKSEKVRNEFKDVKDIDIDTKTWKASVLRLMEEHEFYTKTAKHERSEQKQKHMIELRSEICEIALNYKPKVVYKLN